MNELPPTIRHLGRYDIVRVLGQGAMGVVYEGRDPNIDRRVAIKTVRVVGMAATEIAEYEQRFATEARSAGRLQHPNIVSVYDSDKHVDATGQTAYIVMEFVQGQDLKHFLDHGKRFSLEQTVSMITDLLSALDYAHKNNIVHRDIKPANMLLTQDGRIKLTDFGVARITDSGEATKTGGSTVGTLKYMSPEQVSGKTADASSDLFSAGVVLYQLLAGVRPFDGEGYLDIVSKIVKEDPIAPSQVVDALPIALDAVVAKALQKSKFDRFKDAASFMSALRSAVSNADMSITPISKPRLSSNDEGNTFPDTQAQSNTGGSTVTQELELVYWKEIKDSTEADELEGFLNRFPAGIYSDLAKRKLKSLAQPKQANGSASAFATTQQHKLGTSADAYSTTKQSVPISHSADNDSVFGTSTQFAVTQFQGTDAAALHEIRDHHVTDTGDANASAGDTTGQLSPAAKKKVTRVRLGVIAGVVSLAICAGIIWLPGGSRPSPSSAAAVKPATATIPTATASVSASNAQPETVAPSADSAESVTAGPPAASVPQSANLGTSLAKSSATAASAPKIAPPKRKASAPVVRPAPDSGSTFPTAAIPTSDSEPAAPVPPRSSPTVTTSPPAPSSPPPSSARAPSSPNEACNDRILFGYLTCMATQCARPVFRNHAVCVERREMEERRRSSQPSN